MGGLHTDTQQPAAAGSRIAPVFRVGVAGAPFSTTPHQCSSGPWPDGPKAAATNARGRWCVVGID